MVRSIITRIAKMYWPCRVQNCIQDCGRGNRDFYSVTGFISLKIILSICKFWYIVILGEISLFMNAVIITAVGVIAVTYFPFVDLSFWRLVHFESYLTSVPWFPSLLVDCVYSWLKIDKSSWTWLSGKDLQNLLLLPYICTVCWKLGRWQLKMIDS